jgi:uncharacterized membrane protein YoaK (UPF0700 family)
MDGIEILRFLPGIIAWVFGIVMAVTMIRRGGGKTEKLLLAGCSLLLLTIIVTMIFLSIRPWIREQEISAVEYSFIYSLPNGILSLAGFILLVWAFWKKFWIGGQSPS